MHQGPITAATGTVMWTGRSGTSYRLSPVAPASLHVTEDAIFLITASTADGELVVWTGTAQSLIDDPSSRALFRAALPRAHCAYRMPAPADGTERETVLWDLEATLAPRTRNAA